MYAVYSCAFADCPSRLPTKPHFCHNKLPYFDFHRFVGTLYHLCPESRLKRLICALSVFLVCFALAVRSLCFAVHRLVSAHRHHHRYIYCPRLWIVFRHFPLLRQSAWHCRLFRLRCFVHCPKLLQYHSCKISISIGFFGDICLRPRLRTLISYYSLRPLDSFR